MMKKRLLASLLAAAMTLTMAPAAFAAEDMPEKLDSSPVAYRNDLNYDTIEEAIATAHDGDTITLLKDINETVTIPADKDIWLNLDKHSITTDSGCAIVNKGRLGITSAGTGEATISANGKEAAAIANFPGAVAEVYNVNLTSSAWYVIKNMGEMTICSDTTVKKPDGSEDTSSLIDNGWCASTDTVAGEAVSAQPNKAKLTIEDGEFKGKSGAKSCSVVKNDDYGTLNITGGTFDSTNNQGTENATTILNWNVTEISGGTFTGSYPISNGAYTGDADKGQITISDGDFTGTQSLLGYGQGGNGVGAMSITGGNFTAPKFGDFSSAYTLEISGGTFTNINPKDYLASGYVAKQADQTKSEYEVTPVSSEETNKVIDAEVTTGTTTKAVSTEIQSDNEKNAAANQITVAPAENAALPAEAASPEEKAAAITKLGLTDGTIPENTTVTVTKTTYLAVEITDIDVHEETAKVTMEITPKYDLSATKETDGTQPVVANLVKGQEYKVTAPTVVEVKLPEVFKGKKVYITHKDDIYVVTAGEDGTVKFTTNGFSPFEFSLTAKDVAAEVGGAAYKDFQTAVTAAKDNETVYVIGSDTEYKATISGASKTIKVENGKSDTITVTINNTVKTIKPQETAEFTYTKPSSGSSSGSSSSKTTYKVTTSSVANGGVNVSPSSSAKGDKVKITLSPNKGYKLDKLTVTDASGKTVSTTKTSDTVYTFTMPASQVTVGVTYVKAEEPTEQPSTKTFSDVSSSDWFADAVKYVSDKGMMNGTGTGKFSPADSTTRAMLMTVIARYAGEDTTGSDPWYQKGMEWAKANGVSDGTEPNANITREQLVTMLYRYAKASGKDVSVGEDTNILSYADATTVSQYAIPAMQWACGAGIVNGANGKLNPQNNATRAEVAAILMRFCENVK